MMMKDLDHILEEIHPILAGLESGRRLYLRRRLFYGTLLFVPLLALAGIGLVHVGRDEAIGWFFGAGGWFVLGIILYQVRAAGLGRAYARQYKAAVVSALLARIDPQLNYDPAGGISSDTFRHSELFTTRPDRFRSEDKIEGRYGQTYLWLAEVHAEEKRKSDKSTYYVTTFKGLLLIADFPKHFHGRTFVFPDFAESAFGSVGRFFQKFAGRTGTNLIQLEDPEFEARFAVYSTDEVESRYILSTSLMRRLLDMQHRFGKDVRIAFKDSSLMLAVPHDHPYLEPVTHLPATDPHQVQRFLSELTCFLTVIEDLNLNTRIWTKV